MPRSHPFTAHIPSLTNKEGILYDVVGVGNALVDMIAMVDDAFLASHDMVKGSMALIETDRAVQLSTAVGTSTRTSGGSGANFIVKWESKNLSNPPIIESVMIGTQSQLGISFTSRGQAIQD